MPLLGDPDLALDGSKLVRPTVSIGVAAAQAQNSLDQLLALADQAMYLAKRDGRNRVVSDAGAVARR